VSAADDVLGAALAAGIPLPHSCRAGRCASCKARLLAGEIAYPGDVLPPGIVAAEAARGEVLLCQARPRSDLMIESRRAPLRASLTEATLLGIELLPLDALLVRLRLAGNALAARPGQFVNLKNSRGDEERLTVIGQDASELKLEASPDGSPLREWLDSRPAAGTLLWLAGPFDRPR
jgi:CDP-4-dehydro-6-deoxyglucose reductase